MGGRQSLRRNWFRTLDRTLNRVARRAAHSGRGPFSVVRHVGRRSSRAYETPVMLARTPRGLMAELTYGPRVDWYRNVVAAGSCEVLHQGRWYHVDGVEAVPTRDGYTAFGPQRSMVLRLLRRREFVLLRTVGRQEGR